MVSCLDAADDINRIASTLYTLGTQDSTDLCKYEQTLYTITSRPPLSADAAHGQNGNMLTSHPRVDLFPVSPPVLRFFLKVSELFEKIRVRSPGSV